MVLSWLTFEGMSSYALSKMCYKNNIVEGFLGIITW